MPIGYSVCQNKLQNAQKIVVGGCSDTGYVGIYLGYCKIQGIYILIRYPAQTNIKHLSCNKQPQLGCVNTSRVRPSLLCLHQQNGWK